MEQVPSPELERLIVAQAPDAILYADAEGLIRLWNRGAERIFGVSAADALGRSLDLIIPEKLRPRHWDGWQQVMCTGETRYGEALLKVPAIRHDGSQFSSEFSIVMVKGGDGRVLGVAAVLRDVSAQWEREKALKARLQELSGGVG